MDAGFTGTRKGLTPEQIIALEDLLVRRNVRRLHHGDCLGADAQAHAAAMALYVRPVLHPADDETGRAFCSAPARFIRRPKPPLDRNRDIVNETHELYAGVAGPEQLRSGTWATVRYARKRNRPRYLIWPDGRVEQEGT